MMNINKGLMLMSKFNEVLFDWIKSEEEEKEGGGDEENNIIDYIKV